MLFSHPIPILRYTSAYGKCIGFSINFPQYGKMQQNPWHGESLGNWYSYFSHSMSAFFPSDSYPVVYFSIWQMYGFPHKFPTVREDATKPMVWEQSRKLILILFPWYGCFYSIRFRIVWYTSLYGKYYEKMQQNASYGVNLGNRCSYFSHSIGDLFPYDSHPMAYLIKWEMHGFPHQFLIVQENATKSHRMRRAWEIGPPTFPIVWVLFSIRFPFYGILHHMGNACVFSLISHNMENDSQTCRMGKFWKTGSR